jgi:hypothetical protein
MNQAVVEAGIDDSDFLIFQETPIFAVHRYEGRLLLKEIKVLTVIAK